MTRSHRAVGDTVETKRKIERETKPEPRRDKISQSSGRKQSGRQSQVHVVTRSHKAVRDTVEDTVGDKA